MTNYTNYSKERLIKIIKDRDYVLKEYKESISFQTYLKLCEKSADRYDEILELEKKLLVYTQP